MSEHKNIIGLFAGALTSVGLAAQVWQILQSHRSTDVSAPFFLLLLVGTIMWTVHGVRRGDLAIIVWDVFGMLLCTAVLVLKLFYG